MKAGTISAYIVKANAGYQCQKCGSDELVQSHHQVPGDDSTQTCLCAECHSLEHPSIPKGLFCSMNCQPYWFNKPASRIAREQGVCSRTIIRMAKKLDIPRGDLAIGDEALIIGHLEITRRKETQAQKEETRKRTGMPKIRRRSQKLAQQTPPKIR